MSMHNIPLTTLEHDGLTKHHLPIDKPSQLSDCFRHGMKWAFDSALPQSEVVYDVYQQIHFKPLDIKSQAYYIANMNRILDAFEMHLESYPDTMFELWIKQWRAGVEGIHKTNKVEF